MDIRMTAMTVTILFAAVAQAADIPEEFQIKRQDVFEFTDKPVMTATADSRAWTIKFTSKGYCDATVAIEDAGGRIVRHLASGVLGPKAPAPLQPNSLAQTIIWDGKDDRGELLDEKTAVVARVSLGLMAQFERTLF
ncbi:MAG: hypothetical protein PHU85_06265 [Phycisphaerae bacterium]|nr:hypothetical protein [Phycisphaerae bacterium]